MSIPPAHKVGEIEWPTTAVEPGRDIAVLERSNLTEAEFAKRVAAASHNGEAVIFVHGSGTAATMALANLK